MKAIVTGAAGFIGSHLSDLLLEKGFNVIGIDDLSSGSLQNLKEAMLNKKFTFEKISILESDKLETFFKNTDYVYHLAGKADIVPSINAPSEYHDVNVTGTLNILELSKKFNIKKLVYAASSSCYGIPQNYPTTENENISPRYPYALTKFLAEEYILHWNKVYKLPTISLRLFNVYGTRSRTSGAYGAVLGTFLGQKLAQKPATIVGTGEQTRDFINVYDVCNAFYIASKEARIGEVYNIGTGNPQSINTLVNLLNINEKTFIPKRPGEPDTTHADISKVTNDTSWRPLISLKEGIANILKQSELWEGTKAWEPSEIEKETQNWFKYLKDDQ